MKKKPQYNEGCLFFCIWHSSLLSRSSICKGLWCQNYWKYQICSLLQPRNTVINPSFSLSIWIKRNYCFTLFLFSPCFPSSFHHPFFSFFLSQIQWCSGFTPSSELKDHSWLGTGASWRADIKPWSASSMACVPPNELFL